MQIADRFSAIGTRVSGWARVERLLAAVCALAPPVMVAFDTVPWRESISAYYAMTENQWFYVPFAVAVMLFFVNGITKQQHWYNILLAAALLGVLMFDQDEHQVVHTVFASLFFGGAAAVVVWWSDSSAAVRYGVALGLVAIGAITWAIGWLTFWLAEYVALLAITVHFILDSSSARYQALPRGVEPWTRRLASGPGQTPSAT